MKFITATSIFTAMKRIARPSTSVVTRAAAAARLGVVLGFTLALAGCGMFATRDPENPINAGSGFERATTPSLVLRNLESALNYSNAGDYRKCFADTARGLRPYAFVPSVQGMAAAPSVFLDWSIDDEEEYLRNIFADLRDGSVASVVFTPSEVSGVQFGDSVRFTADYVVRFPHTRLGAEEEASGSMELTFRQSQQNEWYIASWRDISRGDRPSWSLIKARFIDR